MKLLLILIPFLLFSQNYPVGINLVNDFAFIDIVKTTPRYTSVEGFDQQGWPTSDFEYLFDNRPVAEWIGVIDDPDGFRPDISGMYKCSFVGSADIFFWGTVSIENKEYDSDLNLTTFDMIIPENTGATDWGFYGLNFTNTKRNQSSSLNSGITNLKIHRPGYPLDTEKIFTDEYIELCNEANFTAFRYYVVQNIWGGELEYPNKIEWEDRKLATDAYQVDMRDYNGKSEGWSWDYIIELANILNKDIWICLHQSQSDEYIQALAQHLFTNLNPSINIILENSNEVWDPNQLTHGPYNMAYADDYGLTFDEAYADRTVKVGQLFKQAFAEPERVKMVLGAQAGWFGRSLNHVEYIQDNYGDLSDFVDVIAPALYFGSSNPDGTPDQINQGMYDDINEQINNDRRLGFLNPALENGIEAFSYEGGNHIPAGGGTDNLTNQIEACRTEEMGEILKYNYKEAWFDHGGGLAMHFTLLGDYQRYGCWGLTDDPFNPDRNHKFQAIRELTEKVEETFSVTVTGGYGSGDYSEGDTVYIFAREFSDSEFFESWSSDNLELIDNLESWRFSFVMPAENLEFQASFKENLISLNFIEIDGVENKKPVYYHLPENSKGTVLLFHGTGGSAEIVNRATEIKHTINQIINNGFGLIVSESEESTTGLDKDDNGKIRWEVFPLEKENNIDFQNIELIINHFISEELLDERVPKLAMGISNGAFFAQTISAVLDFDAVVSFIGQGNAILYDGQEPIETDKPTMWIMAENDTNEGIGELGNQIAFSNYNNQTQKGICTDFEMLEAYPLYPERFMRADFSEQQSVDLFDELKNSDILDNHNIPMYNLTELQAELAERPNDFPLITELNPIRLLAFARQYSISRAEHTYFDDFNSEVLDFLENECIELSVFSNLEQISVYPNPSTNIINLEFVDDYIIYDLLGNKLIEEINTNSININELKYGTYLIKSENYSGKFIKN